MTDRDGASGLRAARAARTWSQADAARELATMARARGAPVAATASLKTLLSRWENGHARPDPQYRSLLAELYGRSITELGLGAPGAPGADPTDGLTASLAAAAAAAGAGVRLWRRQLELAREMDDELGAAGAGELVHAQVERLAETLLHTIPQPARTELAELLTEAAALAGEQELDRRRHDRAWRQFDRARVAARDADRPAAGAVAVAGQAAVLVDAGEPDTAARLLEQVPPLPDGWPQARLDAALAMARAAAGRAQESRQALAAAEQRLRRPRIDLVDHRDRPSLHVADLHRWQGSVLVALGDAHAVEPLRQALAAEPRSTRHRAALHADLALALDPDRPQEAADHAGTARRLAAGIGSERIPARLTALGGRR